MRIKAVTLAALTVAAAYLPSTATAAVITRTFAIEATDFDRVAGLAGRQAPFSSVNGSFTVTFDTMVDSGPVLLLSDLNLPTPYGTGLNYTYQSGNDRLNIAQTPSTNGNDGPFSPGSIYFSIQGASTATPSLRNIINGAFLVTNTAQDAQFNTNNASVRIVSVTTPAVPEPASWMLMIAGFGVLGAALRYRRSRTTLAV